LFQVQRLAYFSLSRIRLIVAGDQPFVARMLPGTFSSLNVFTICVSGWPSATSSAVDR
jgi:hypothetical protein